MGSSEAGLRSGKFVCGGRMGLVGIMGLGVRYDGRIRHGTSVMKCGYCG